MLCWIPDKILNNVIEQILDTFDRRWCVLSIVCFSMAVCKQRAVGVSVSKHQGRWKCATAGDNHIKIWDLAAKLCILDHTAHNVGGSRFHFCFGLLENSHWPVNECYFLHKAAIFQNATVTCVDWSPVDPHLVISADSTGHIVTWRTDTDVRTVMTLEASHVSVVACSTHDKHVIAVG